MVYPRPNICSCEWDTHTPLGFWHTNGSPNPRQTTRHYNHQQQKKENLKNCGLCCPGWPLSKIERKWKERLIPRPCLGIEKGEEHESVVYTNCNWCSWYSHQRINKGTVGLGNKRTSGNPRNYCIIEIDQNTEESRRFAETCCHLNFILGWKV